MHWILGGNCIDYPGVIYTPDSNITTAKLLSNSVISTKNENFIGIDLKDFYLNTQMERYEYMLVLITMVLQDIMNEYKLGDILHNDMVLGEIRKDMYGLPQVG